jgi:hypothetical protein
MTPRFATAYHSQLVAIRALEDPGAIFWRIGEVRSAGGECEALRIPHAGDVVNDHLRLAMQILPPLTNTEVGTPGRRVEEAQRVETGRLWGG